MLLGAAPTWFSDNVVLIAIVTLLVVTLLIVRMVTKTAVRIMLLCIVAAIAVFIYANRLGLEQCAKTCACNVANQDITLPACDVDLTP